MVRILFNLQLIILVYIIIGIVLKKINLIDNNGQNFLTNFIVDFLLPINIFVSIYSSVEKDALKRLSLIFLVAVIFETCIFIYTRINKNIIFNKGERSVANFAYILPNSVFIGTPVIEGLFQEAGLVISNVFLIPFRSFAYACGESIFDQNKKSDFKSVIINLFKNRVVQITIIAFILKFMNIQLPSFINTAFVNISKCMSPMSLILVGSILSENVKFDYKKLLKVLLISFVRLIVFPLIGLLICKILKFDLMTTTVICVLLGMPAASSTAIYARKYHGDVEFASLTVLISTILSAFTLLLLVRIIELV